MYTYPDGLLFWTRGPHSTASKDWKDRANFITDYFFTHVQTKLQLTTSELRNLMKQQGDAIFNANSCPIRAHFHAN